MAFLGYYCIFSTLMNANTPEIIRILRNLAKPILFGVGLQEKNYSSLSLKP